MRLVFDSSSGLEFLQKAKALTPNILLVSSHTKDIPLTSLPAEVKRLSRQTSIVCLDYDSEFDFSQPAVRPYITGVFSTMTYTPEQIISNLYRLSGMNRKALEKLELRERSRPYSSEAESRRNMLSDRELAVLRFYAEGFTEREIGECLGIVDKTVEKHKYSIKQKLQCRSPLSALTFALRNGIIE
jgi:DNA-binding NarL/FixJ family response regulator